MRAKRVARLEKEISGKPEGLGPNDVLLVPDLSFLVAHEYAELQGRTFSNKRLKRQRMDVIRQEIRFRLDKSGAELKSEAKMYCLPLPSLFHFDRPFMIYIKKRGADAPYFAMWVAGPELLKKW